MEKTQRIVGALKYVERQGMRKTGDGDGRDGDWADRDGGDGGDEEGVYCLELVEQVIKSNIVLGLNEGEFEFVS
jgi:hypothetical protein